MNERWQAYADMATDVVKGAGSVLRQHYHDSEGATVSHKGMIDLVTTADHAAEAYILERLREHFPQHGIVAEESGREGDSRDYRWIVDPLDGTVNFAHRLPHFCTLLGLQERGDDGTYRTCLGLTFDPLREELFTAIRGEGATLNGASISVSSTERLIDSAVATGFGYNRLFESHDNHAEFCRLNLLTRGVRRFGSAGLDLAYVACGRFDFYWEYELNSWDLTPGALLVQEAGGLCTAPAGAAFSQPDIMQAVPLAASNGLVHAAALAALRSAGELPVNSRDGLSEHLPADVAAKLADG